MVSPVWTIRILIIGPQRSKRGKRKRDDIKEIQPRTERRAQTRLRKWRKHGRANTLRFSIIWIYTDGFSWYFQSTDSGEAVNNDGFLFLPLCTNILALSRTFSYIPPFMECFFFLFFFKYSGMSYVKVSWKAHGMILNCYFDYSNII